MAAADEFSMDQLLPLLGTLPQEVIDERSRTSEKLVSNSFYSTHPLRVTSVHFTPHFTSRNCKEAELGGCLPCTAGAQQNRMLDSSAIPKITVSTEITGSCQECGTTFPRLQQLPDNTVGYQSGMFCASWPSTANIYQGVGPDFLTSSPGYMPHARPRIDSSSSRQHAHTTEILLTSRTAT